MLLCFVSLADDQAESVKEIHLGKYIYSMTCVRDYIILLLIIILLFKPIGLLSAFSSAFQI